MQAGRDEPRRTIKMIKDRIVGVMLVRAQQGAVSITYAVKNLGTLGSLGILEQKSVSGRGARS
jgi:hypothetical protein